MPKGRNGCRDVVEGHLARRRPAVPVRNRRGRDGGPRCLPATREVVVVERVFTVPGTALAGLAPGMRQLNAGNRSLGLQKARDTGQIGDVVIMPDAEVAGRAPAPFLDGRGLTEDEAGAPQGKAPEMDKVPVVGETVRRPILAHRRYCDAIGDLDVADLDGRKQGHGAALVQCVEGLARGSKHCDPCHLNRA